MVRPRLDAFATRASAAGVAQVSGRLASPTVGGQSWLAHATLLSGLRVEDELAYRLLLSGDRQTLVHAFRRAGWRTVGLMPAITRPWPEGERMGFDEVYAAAAMGCKGPRWSGGVVPDQFGPAD